ncbi:MAG: PrsW family intramembrane metalloprotease [Synechococcaceae cyanobacterium]|nr:PrsW family intramembrane metalloprotease [Synechococcaceae cyanobacterium]
MIRKPDSRFLHGSPLGQPRIARFAAVILAVLVEVSTGVIVKTDVMRLAPEARSVFLAALGWSALLAIPPLAVLWFLDRRERESIWLYVVMFLWGALIATALSSPLKNLLLPEGNPLFLLRPDLGDLLGPGLRRTLVALLSTPVIEEVAKGIGVLLAFQLLKAEFDSVRDGFVYGALVGVGFNLMESAFYVADAYAATGVAPWWQYLALHHSLFGFGGHVLYTGLFGMGLGLARQTVRPWLHWLAPVATWLGGLTAHLIGNLMALLTILLAFIATGRGLMPAAPTLGVSPSDPAFWVLLVSGSYISIFWAFPFLVIAGVMLWQSGVWERRVIRDELEDEHEPVITGEEYDGILRDRIFRTRRVAAATPHQAHLIVRAQNELAIRKWRLRHMGEAIETDPLVASWREELGRLRTGGVAGEATLSGTG